jgi:hypothetical protein
MNTYGGADVYIHVFLASALIGGELSASRPGRFTPGERDSATHWIGGYTNTSITDELGGSRDSVVGIATGYGLDDRGVGVRVENFLFPTSSRPPLGLT